MRDRERARWTEREREKDGERDGETQRERRKHTDREREKQTEMMMRFHCWSPAHVSTLLNSLTPFKPSNSASQQKTPSSALHTHQVLHAFLKSVEQTCNKLTTIPDFLQTCIYPLSQTRLNIPCSIFFLSLKLMFMSRGVLFLTTPSTVTNTISYL